MSQAARFGVAPSTVINWVRRFGETGSVAPRLSSAAVICNKKYFQAG